MDSVAGTEGAAPPSLSQGLKSTDKQTREEGNGGTRGSPEDTSPCEEVARGRWFADKYDRGTHRSTMGRNVRTGRDVGIGKREEGRGRGNRELECVFQY